MPWFVTGTLGRSIDMALCFSQGRNFSNNHVQPQSSFSLSQSSHNIFPADIHVLLPLFLTTEFSQCHMHRYRAIYQSMGHFSAVTSLMENDTSQKPLSRANTVSARVGLVKPLPYPGWDVDWLYLVLVLCRWTTVAVSGCVWRPYLFQKTAFPCAPPHPPGSYILSVPSSMMFSELWCGGGQYRCLLRVDHPTTT